MYEISCVETVVLGGYRQKILLEGRSRNNPLLITLHGGPGLPIPFCVGSRGLFPEITERFLLVCWDQYGCGINNAVIDDGFTIADFTKMTVDLVRHLKNIFPDNKLFLFGMSWGSILSAQTAAMVPELIDGVLVYGQVLAPPLRSQEALRAILESKAPGKVKKQAVALISQGHMSKTDCMKISGYIRRYTEGYANRKEPKMPVGKMLKGLLKNPDYRLKDMVAMFKNGYAGNRSLAEAVSTVDLSRTLRHINVPYHIIQGDTDIVTPTPSLIRFLSSCNPTFITGEVVQNAAHIPGRNGMAAVMKRLQHMAGTAD